jgi:hypothetical protein
MKKSSKKKSTGKFLNSRNIRWFGIDVHHIALGVSFVGCVVAFLLVQKHQSLEEQQVRVLAAEHSFSMTIGDNDNGSSSARPTCIPRPPCLDTSPPKCMIPTDVLVHFCPPHGTPTPTLTPPSGCFYKRICMMIACSAEGKCENCRTMLVCPSRMPHPSITCAPRPTCAAGQECPQTTNENIKWCPPTQNTTPGTATGSAVNSTTTSLTAMWNNFLRSFLRTK